MIQMDRNAIAYFAIWALVVIWCAWRGYDTRGSFEDALGGVIGGLVFGGAFSLMCVVVSALGRDVFGWW